MIKKELIYLDLRGVTYRQKWQYLRIRKMHSRDESVFLLIKTRDWPAKLKFVFTNWQDYSQQIDRLSKMAVLFGQANYPKRWIHLPQPPLLFYFKGNLALLNHPLVAIIGSRKLSDYGMEMASLIARQVSQAGMIVVSGLASGVDYLAHRSSMHLGNYRTIAILANGFHYYYPKEHRELQNQIGKHHLLISEYPPDQGIRKHQFIARNRLVAGLCSNVIVIQAAKQSGSLITANYALDYNSQIYALPGPITDPQSYGCNALIQAGARPIVDIAGLLDEIQLDNTRQMGNFYYNN